MTSDTTIEKMESTPFSRQIDSVVSLSFDGESAYKPHIFACYNNEVSSSLYLHNKLIVLDLSQSCNSSSGSSAQEEIEEMFNDLLNDVDDRLNGYLQKELFYEYINRPTGNKDSYIRYIESLDLLYTDKMFASAKGFVMYSTGEHDTGGDGGLSALLSKLLDVSLSTTIGNNDLLSYNLDSQKWQNIPISSINGGTLEHSSLLNRDLADQHPLSAITGLTEAISNHTHDNYLSSITKQMVEGVLTGDINSHYHSKYALLNGSSAEDFYVKDLNASGIGRFVGSVVMFGAEGGTGGGTGGGGMDIPELERYLTTNPESWKLALSYLPSWIDITKPAYSWAEIYNKPNVITDSDYRLTNARPADGGTSDYANGLKTNLLASIFATFDGVSRWELKSDHSIYKGVKVDYAMLTDELYAPDRGRGYLRIGTSRGLITGDPEPYPVIKTNHDSVYFDIGGVYCGSIAKSRREGVMRLSDAKNGGIEFYHHNGTLANIYCGTVLSAGTVVMYSTT